MSLDSLLSQPFGTAGELIRAGAAHWPSRTAIVQGGHELDYAGLNADMDRVAAALQRDAVQAREAIAICAGTSIGYATVFLGALRAGIAVAPLAPSSTAQSIVSMIGDAGAKLLFVDSDTARTLAPVRAGISARVVMLDGSGADPALEQWLAPRGAQPAPVAIEPHWPFNIIYSSGTTGAPKGIVQPCDMRWGQMVRGQTFGYGPDAVTLLSTPLYSNTTLVSFFPTVALGGTLVLMPKFDVDGYLAIAEHRRVTHTMLVPVQYQRIMAHPGFAGFDLSAFRQKFSTSAPFSVALKADILERWPGRLTEFYGMTEGGGTCILQAHDHPDKLHTVGQPAEGHDIRLIDEAGHEVAAGEPGEVVGHSSLVMTGYHNRPDQTADAEWRDANGKRFIRTGDIGRFDADGFLTLFDRRKDMIISGGFNIYPSDLEAILSQHPEVADVAVIAAASTRWGETPVAFVVPAAGAALVPHTLLAWVNERLGRMQRIAALELIDVLPRSAIGKVLKRELRDAYTAKTGALP